MSGSDSSASPTARTRQAFSTERVTGIVGHEHRHRLVLFPFVPYAISLSLSVSYREMRRSKIPMLRARARIAFEANCLILKELGEKFSSAAVMADMGNMTLEEVDRAYSRVTDESRRRQSIGLAGPVTGKSEVTKIIDLRLGFSQQSNSINTPKNHCIAEEALHQVASYTCASH